MHEDIKCSHKDLLSKKNELILNNKCEEHDKKNKIGFYCTYCKEICSTFNDSHVKYTNQDKWKYIFDNLDFNTINQFEDIINKMNKKILSYKNNQLKNLTKFYENLMKTFIVYENIPSYIINENASKFQFNKNFFIIELCY